MNGPLFIQSQLLSTKLYTPVAAGPLVIRPRLNTLLTASLKYPLTLISAPAGFGKTTALAAWACSLQTSQPVVAWLSLDEDDNDPKLFWTYVLAALDKQQPEYFNSLFQYLQLTQVPSLRYVTTALINQLIENDRRMVLILDGYHLITEPEVHTALSYLVQHLPAQLHIMISTRVDPPLSLAQWRARGQVLEVRTPELRCTVEETRAFLQIMMGVQLPTEMAEAVTAQTEGWLVGLKLLGCSIPGHVNPTSLLEKVSGDQHYILEYLTEEVLRQQTPEMQRFLLCTCILDQLTGSLCDTVTAQTDSQQLLEQLERANLFLESLDSRRQCYRYHALFAEALHCQLEKMHADLVPVLHMRASQWYAQHNHATQAILHAFEAKEWHWAADLIEQAYLSLISFTCEINRYALIQLRRWLEQLPAEVIARRPQLCLACVHILWIVTPQPILHTWLDLAEATLKTALEGQTAPETSSVSLTAQARRDYENLLGELIAMRAFLWSYQEDGQAALAFCEQAEVLLLAENAAFCAIVALAKLISSYTSVVNDAVAAIESGYQAVLFAQVVGQPAVAIAMIAKTAIILITAGRLREAKRLTQQAMLQGTLSDNSRLPEMGWSIVWQAEILRERNELDAARSLATEGITLCEQASSPSALSHLISGYTVLVRVYLSCGDLDAACAALQHFEQIGRYMNKYAYLLVRSLFTTIDQVRLWLARGELDRATCWVRELDLVTQYDTPFAHERRAVACARVYLATAQPNLALQRLEPALQRASAGQRWGHVLEIRLLQALAYQMSHEESQALNVLAEAVRLGEPEGYIRSFVEEGAAMAVLLTKLREVQHKDGATPYLDRVLAAFPQPSKMPAHPHKQRTERTPVQPRLELLSEREQQVLQLLAQCASNQEIAQELDIVESTVKRHVSHICAKLGVHNRIQAISQAQELGLLNRQF